MEKQDFSCCIERNERGGRVNLSFVYKFDKDKYTEYWVEMDGARIDFTQQEKLTLTSDISNNVPKIIFLMILP